MSRPLIWTALSYAAGLLAGKFAPGPLPALFAAAFLVLLAALRFARWRPWLIWPLVFLAGWTNLACRAAILSPVDLRRLQGERVEIVTLRGALAETPSERLYLRDGELASRSLAELEARELVRRDGKSEPCFGRTLVLTPGTLPAEFYRGQRVEVTGVLGHPPGPKAEGLFDYRAYLRNEGVYYTLRTGMADWKLLSPAGVPPWDDRFIAWARQTLSRDLPGLDEPLRLLLSMTLGLKNAVESRGYEPFIQTGTMHIFAISGLHIALIGGILVSVLRVVRAPRAWCGAVVLPLIWIYTAATGWQPSAIRATIMMSIIIGGWALRRPSDLLNSLAAAALIILVWEPRQLFGASFQLSFFVVLSIALLLPPVERWRDALLRHDPLLPAELAPRWRRWGMTGARWLSNSVAVSLAAWLGALPITAAYFHLFSPVTLLANLFVVPLSSLALASNVGSLACGALPGPLAVWFNHSAWFWMHCIVKISDWLAAIPLAFLHVPRPGIAGFLSYYAVLFGLASGRIFAPAWRRWTLLSAGLMGGLQLWLWGAGQTVSTLSILPLDGGASVFSRAGSARQDFLVDTGPARAANHVLKPFLAAKGVNWPAALVLTHGDIRQMGGAELVAAAFPPRRVCVSPVPQRSAAYKAAVQGFSQKPGQLREIRRRDQLGPWRVLHPSAEDRFPRADDAALTLRGEIGGVRVLLLSDLGRDGQETLLERGDDLESEIVVAGLPAQGEALGEGLLERIQPRAIIITDSETPAYKQARPELIERLQKRRVPVLRTRKTGALTIRIVKGGWAIQTVDGQTLASGQPHAPNKRPPPR